MGILNWSAVFSRLLLRLRANLIRNSLPGCCIRGSPGQVTSLEILIPLVSTLLPLLHRRSFCSIIGFLLYKTEGQTNSRKTAELYSEFLDITLVTTVTVYSTRDPYVHVFPQITIVFLRGHAF